MATSAQALELGREDEKVHVLGQDSTRVSPGTGGRAPVGDPVIDTVI